MGNFTVLNSSTDEQKFFFFFFSSRMDAWSLEVGADV